MSNAVESVLGGLLIGGPDAYWKVADLLTPADFIDHRYAAIYEAVRRQADARGDIDVITIGDELQRIGKMRQSEVIALAAATHSAANIRSHAELVREESIKRKVRGICVNGAKSGDAGQVQAEIAEVLKSQPAYALPAKEALNRMFQGMVQRYNQGEELAGISTGFPLIDEYTNGLQGGRVYGIGARAKMGKTMLAMNICLNAAVAGKSVGIWSLEMTGEELMQRMTAAHSGVTFADLQNPKRLDDNDNRGWSLVNGAVKTLRDVKLKIADKTDVTIEQIEAQARQMKAGAEGLDLICIDYLGLLKLPKMDRHDLAIAHATRRVKIISKELGIPVILVFQLNRGSESGATPRAPMPSDARDSGAIEQDLDVMLLLHRPSYYDRSGQTESGLRLDVALQRNGATGLIKMDDDLARCRFLHTADPWIDQRTSNNKYDNL